MGGEPATLRATRRRLSNCARRSPPLLQMQENAFWGQPNKATAPGVGSRGAKGSGRPESIGGWWRARGREARACCCCWQQACRARSAAVLGTAAAAAAMLRGAGRAA